MIERVHPAAGAANIDALSMWFDLCSVAVGI
jgi:hypothetical protein